VAIATQAAVGGRGERSVEIKNLENLNIPNVQVIPQRLVSTPTNFSKDIVASISQENFSALMIPWDSSNSDNNDVFDYNTLINQLIVASPIPTVIFAHSSGVVINKTGALIVVYGGTSDDQAALEFIVNSQTPFHLFLCKKQFLKDDGDKKDEQKSDEHSSPSVELPVQVSWSSKDKELIDKVNLLAKEDTNFTVTYINNTAPKFLEELDKKIAGISGGVSLVIMGRNSHQGLGKAADKILHENWSDVVVVAAPDSKRSEQSHSGSKQDSSEQDSSKQDGNSEEEDNST